MNIAWKIENLVRQPETGVVIEAHWRANASDGEAADTAYGSVVLPAPTGTIIPYDALTEQTVIGWVMGVLGDKRFEEIEATLTANVAAQKAPTTATGLPWGNQEDEQ